MYLSYSFAAGIYFCRLSFNFLRIDKLVDSVADLLSQDLFETKFVFIDNLRFCER
jgi:hypothetical protein